MVTRASVSTGNPRLMTPILLHRTRGRLGLTGAWEVLADPSAESSRRQGAPGFQLPPAAPLVPIRHKPGRTGALLNTSMWFPNLRGKTPTNQPQSEAFVLSRVHLKDMSGQGWTTGTPGGFWAQQLLQPCL